VWWISEAVRDGTTSFGTLGTVVEDLLGDEVATTRDAVATCFVESLVNRAPEIPAEVMTHLLGAKGMEIAKSWRDF
jgi:hypothetical protein